MDRNEYLANWREKNRERIRQKAAAWREKHRQAIRESSEARRETYREVTREYMAAWREQKREETRTYMEAWREKNREAVRAYHRENRWKYAGSRRVHQAKRMGIIQEVGPSFTAQDWQRYLYLFGDRCLACGQQPTKLTADHVVPLARGGANTIDNIQGLCQSCNSAKGTRTVDYRVA